MDHQSEDRITPLPGVARRDLLRTLEPIRTNLGNLRGRTTIRGDLPALYLEWVNDSVRMLRFQLPSVELDRLILTRRYWAIQSAQGFESVNLVETEIDDRTTVLERTNSWLEATDRKWKLTPGRLVVADSGFFCNHDKKLREIPFADTLDLRDEPIRLMVPMLVLDELDGLKQHSNDHVRWRAGHTLGVLDEVLDPDGVGLLQDEDYTPLESGGIPRGAVHVEVFFDPPAHRRLPIEDDEIIARALAIQAEAERSVIFWTFDTSQSTRARFRGLAVKKFKRDIGQEPGARRTKR